MTYPIEPTEIVQMVDAFVRRQRHAAEQYENAEVLDDSGVWSLHALAGEIYAVAWDHATRAAEARRTGLLP